MIEDNSADQGVQMGPNSGYSMNSKQNFDEHNSRMEYSMPGILHFLQTEWAKFEMERAQWDVEKAEFQAKIAFLQGERKGQENLKQDLVRRIKMLEFALRQERAKYHKLQYGAEPTQQANATGAQSSEDELEENVQQATTGPSFRQGRQMLKHYLEEIGYTDALLDVRSSRVRSLLGIHSDKNNRSDELSIQHNTSSAESSARMITGPSVKQETSSLEQLNAQMHYMNESGGEVVDDQDDSDEDDSQEDGDDDDDAEERARIAASLPTGNKAGGVVEDPVDASEALAEFDFLMSETDDRIPADDEDGEMYKPVDWQFDQERLNMKVEQYKEEIQKKHNSQRPNRHDLKTMLANLGDDDGSDEDSGPYSPNASSKKDQQMRFPPGNSLDRPLDTANLGALADISITNDDPDSTGGHNEAFGSVGSTDPAIKKHWNPKYTLKSHFDGIRALTFHPVEPVLLTASEDHTLKLWNLQKTVPSKKVTSLDVEPVYTFRAHQGPVLCLAMSATGEECFSGGIDSTIRCWNLPSSNIDPYDSYDQSILMDTLTAHTDAVWGLAVHRTRVQLLSCSADSTVKLWSPGNKMQLSYTYDPPLPSDGVPTCIDFIASDSNQMMASYCSGNTYVFDLTTGQQVIKLQSDSVERINRIVSHPTLSLAMAACSDRTVKFFDTTSGQLVHSMVAHLDAVTSLAVDTNGLYLLTGSHDCSIRVWSMETKACVQEIMSHRKKYDESIFDVAFHPSKPFIGSAGADGIAKVLVGFSEQ